MTDEVVDVPLLVDTEDKPVVVGLDEPKGSKVVTADEGIETLKEQAKRAREDSQRRLAAADREIQEAHRRAQVATEENHSIKVDVVAKSMESLTKDKDQAKRDLQAAHEVGDYARIVDAQDRLSMANAELVEARKAHLALQEQAKQPAPQPQFADDVEKLARQLQPKSAAWIRAHPEFAAGDENKRMLRAHYAAIGDDIEPESEEYFRFVEGRLGLTKTERAEETPRRQEGRASMSAPVGRDVSQAPRRSTDPKSITLSSEEVATARALDMSLEDYAKHKVALMKENKIGNVA